MFEYSGDTLSGVIDGRNQIFGVSSGMGRGSTSVYLNGLLLTPGLDTGWVLINDVTIKLKEPPQFGDTVAVGYTSTTAAYREAAMVPMTAFGAEIVALKPSLGSATLGLGGLAARPLPVQTDVQFVAGPGLLASHLVPELAPT